MTDTIVICNQKSKLVSFRIRLLPVPQDCDAGENPQTSEGEDVYAQNMFARTNFDFWLQITLVSSAADKKYLLCHFPVLPPLQA